MDFRDFTYDLRYRVYEIRSAVIDRFLPDWMSGGQRDHREASGMLERGRKYYNKKNFERAEHYFRKAVASDDSYGLAHYYSGLARYKLDDSDGALEAWRRAIQVEPGSDAAFKADRKIDYVRKHMTRAINELESNVRKR